MNGYRTARLAIAAATVRRPGAGIAIAALALAVCSPALAIGDADVGQVSLLIGQAQVVRADGTSEALHRGSSIRVGDRIETAGNGHVHVHFIDDAAVSVRPGSTLEVQAYRYDKARPELNEVRLTVDKGVSRSISGKATEFDKNRFRLNTPLAAIGVRGTDFIVQTDPEGVRATVSDGAIVVGALGKGCSADALGPCAGAKTLSADMGLVMAEIRPGELGTRIVPAVDLVVAGRGTRDERDGNRPLTLAESRAAGLAAAEPTNAELQRNDRAAAELLTLVKLPLPLPLPLPGEPTVTPVPFAARFAEQNKASDVNAQLIWGRYQIAAAAEDHLTTFFPVARLGRHVTVGDGDASLFRANQTVPGELFSDSLQGVVNFSLNRAAVSYEVGGSSQAAGVTASALQVDFTRRTFATGLDLLSASGIEGQLRVAGAIRNDGIFTVKDTDQFVSGALSLDGKEAGYLFERNVGDGVFKGRTLWGK
ncbi:MAG: FecR domain-containing protein [Pseudomonadota bacterium]|nr:FecR domain-containing protein [Pseudomonadota bacterium]